MVWPDNFNVSVFCKALTSNKFQPKISITWIKKLLVHSGSVSFSKIVFLASSSLSSNLWKLFCIYFKVQSLVFLFLLNYFLKCLDRFRYQFFLLYILSIIRYDKTTCNLSKLLTELILNSYKSSAELWRHFRIVFTTLTWLFILILAV